MKLTVQEIIDTFGSNRKLYEAIGVSRQSLNTMKKEGFIPATHAIKIHVMGVGCHNAIPHSRMRKQRSTTPDAQTATNVTPSREYEK